MSSDVQVQVRMNTEALILEIATKYPVTAVDHLLREIESRGDLPNPRLMSALQSFHASRRSSSMDTMTSIGSPLIGRDVSSKNWGWGTNEIAPEAVIASGY